MKRIAIPKQELWDEEHERFIVVRPTILHLEHNLVSLYNWESKYHKPLLSKSPMTIEERRDYVRFMTLNEIEDKNAYLALTKSHFDSIEAYINDPMTASTFAKTGESKKGSQFITAELLYCWMSSFNIPYEPCQHWHLNRLLTLIRVCSEENKGPQKVSRGKAMEQQRALNEMRKAQLGTRG